MKITFGSRRDHHLARVCVFFIMAALIAGMIGCVGTTTTTIQDWYDLDDVRDNLAGNYILMNDLDSTKAGYEELAGPDGNDGMGWQPIGALFDPSIYPFTGSFDGQGYEIRDLFINRPDKHYVGLFGYVSEGGVIKDVGALNATVNGFLSIGSLVGENSGTVSNCYATGNISGRASVGGLVGLNTGIVAVCYSSASVTGRVDIGGLVGGLAVTSSSLGTVSGCYATGSVSGLLNVGGLVGQNGGTVSNCYATGNITGEKYIGGLVGRSGYSGPGTVSNSYATGSVTGENYVGGLVGRNTACTVVNSHSTGSVSGNSSVGGLVGWNDGAMSNCYATGNVTGDERVGGLAGNNANGTLSDSYSIGDITGDECVGGLIGTIAYSTVKDCYSTGSVTGNTSVGGLLGGPWNPDYCTVSNCFWDTETSGQATSTAGTGKTTAEMQDIATFTDTEIEGLDEPWDMTTVVDIGERNPVYTWNIVNNETYPFLSWQP